MAPVNAVFAIGLLATIASVGTVERATAQNQNPRNNTPANACTGFCPEFYVSILGGYGSSRTNFDVTPSFNVNGSGGYGEIGAGIRVPVPNSNVFFDARVSGLFGDLGGSTFYAPSGGTYTVRQDPMAIAEGSIGFYMPDAPLLNRQYGQGAFPTFVAGQKVRWSAPSISFGFGIVAFHRFYVDAEAAFFRAQDTTKFDNTGLTTSVRIDIPFTQSVLGTAQFRYNYFPETAVFIPGAVNISTNQFYGGFGITIPLTPLPPITEGPRVM